MTTAPRYDHTFSPADQARLLYLRTQALLGDTKYPGLEFECKSETNRCSLRVHCPDGRCATTGKRWHWNGRWWRLSPHMTDSEIVATCFKAVITALEHEAREAFKFKGASVYDAHLDVHELVKLRQSPKGLAGR